MASLTTDTTLPDGQALDGAYRESAYLAAFPKVANAVADGSLPSGLDHFLRVGRAELLAGSREIPDTFRLTPGPVATLAGRRCRLRFGVSRDTFEEALYAALFPQVARLVSRGVFVSLFDHWLEWGFGDIAVGQQRMNFVPRLAEGGNPPAQLSTAHLDEADYLMAFTSAAPALVGAPPLDPTGHHRIEVRHYRSLRVGALLTRPFGVNVFAPVAMLTPLGHVARAVVQALDHAGLQVDVWPYQDEAGALTFISRAWTRRPRYRINLLLVEPDLISRLFETFAPGTFDDAYTVALLPWQLCPVRRDHVFAFTDIDEIWTGSAFEANAIANVTKVPVHVMPIPVRPSVRMGGQDRTDPSPRPFVFATLLGPGEMGRITALAIIEAFREVAQHTSATLIVAGEGASSLSAATGPFIRIEAGALTDDDLHRLLREADCLIAGHPDAGGTWDLAAALQAGTPIIGMSYAGASEFLDETVGYPVQYRLAELEASLPPYEAGQVWAEPRVVSLADRMRETMQNGVGRSRRAEAGARLAARFSVAAVGTAIASRLQELNLDVPKPRFMDGVESRPPLPGGSAAMTGTAVLRPNLSFSLIAFAARDAHPAELQAIVDAMHAQTYGLWELIVQPDAEAGLAVQTWLNSVRGSSPRISVMPDASQCRPGLVERARGRYLVYSKHLAELPRDTLARMVEILTDEPAIDIVSEPAYDGALAVRKQVLLGLGVSDLQPAEALSSAFRARLQGVTRLARSLPKGS